MNGYMGKILEIDLTHRTVRELKLGDKLCKEYIGGSGIGIKILWDRKIYLYDALSSENNLIFITGPFANTPVITSGRHHVLAKSPLTGILGESDSGGSFGPAIKRSGYDGLIIIGKSVNPIYLWINDGTIEFRNAKNLWGKDTLETDEIIKYETSKRAVIATIGTSGEKMLPIAGIFNNGSASRASARCGLGAVMGSKNLKAIAVSGNSKTEIYNKKELINSLGKISKPLRKKMEGMSKYGTGGALGLFEEFGSLPLKNWKGTKRWKDEAKKIDGIKISNSILTGNYGCDRCIVRCGREITMIDKKYGKVEGAGPEYETLAALGSMCLVSDLNAIVKGNDLCNRYGIDTISVGSSVAFAMELFEKGIITVKDTDGLELNWGDGDAMVKLIELIGKAKGVGKILAKGTKKAAEEIGQGSEAFAIHSHGLEPPMHDPRAFMSLGVAYTTSARGACHLSGFTHVFERTITLPEIGLNEVPDRLSIEGKANLITKCQDLMGVIDSLKICKFMLIGGINILNLIDWYKQVTGIEIGLDEFMEVGERIFNLKRLFNLKCGISPEYYLCQKKRMVGTQKYHRLIR